MDFPSRLDCLQVGTSLVCRSAHIATICRLVLLIPAIYVQLTLSPCELTDVTPVKDSEIMNICGQYSWSEFPSRANP
jgi:hypothetical protein